MNIYPKKQKQIKSSRLRFSRIALVIFVFTHISIAVLLDEFYALAPDEAGYLYTFQHLYDSSTGGNPQFGSGWIAAPKIFLIFLYIPAKLLTLFGLKDILAIRVLSIALIMLSYLILKHHFSPLHQRREKTMLIYLVFFIPSIMLWTSLGLRESCILFSITLIIVGLTKICESKSYFGTVILTLGSYSLMSTKIYLWFVLVISFLMAIVFFHIYKITKLRVSNMIISLILIPTALFTITVPQEGIGFILGINLGSVNQRSGDSVSTLNVTSDNVGNTDVTYIEKGATSQGATSQGATKQIQFHGNYTIVALHFFYKDHPQALFTKFSSSVGLTSKVQDSWEKELAKSLANFRKPGSQIDKSESVLILEKSSLSNPVSLVKSSVYFLIGPWVWQMHSNVAVLLAGLEGPLWVSFYSFVAVTILRKKKLDFFRDFPLFVSLLAVLGMIIFSGLVEVNLGTSFRHRSILLIPLIFICLRILELTTKSEEV